MNETYWGKPIVGFGEINARLMIVGLAPAAHGANRTGRIFTGDRSGQWLYRALHKAGFSNQSTYEYADDGLTLHDTYITCVVKCAPPDNKPLPEETAKCTKFLEAELAQLKNTQVFLVLGKIALDAIWPILLRQFSKADQSRMKKPKLSHGGEYRLPDGRILLMSYHPSQQNTFTGRLTEPMFDSIFTRVQKILTSTSLTKT